MIFFISDLSLSMSAPILPSTFIPSMPCPCGSKQSYQACCQALHQQRIQASSPEALMRSRYCAFVLEQYDYLIETHHIDYRGDLEKDDLKPNANFTWLGLEVLDSEAQGEQGMVLFKAWFKQGKKVDAIFERSNFVFQQRWLYTDGQQFSCPKPKANRPCVCGSGNKFKRCCG